MSADYPNKPVANLPEHTRLHDPAISADRIEFKNMGQGGWIRGEPPKVPGADGDYLIVVSEGATNRMTVDHWHSGTKRPRLMEGWGDPDHGPALWHKREYMPILEMRPKIKQGD